MLKYWIFGDKPSSERLSPLQVRKEMTVAAVKKAITAENHMLSGIDSKCLELWKVSIAVDDLGTKLGNILLRDEPANGIEKLGPKRRVSRIFSDAPLGGHLNLIVRLPAGKHEKSVTPIVRLWCLFYQLHFRIVALSGVRSRRDRGGPGRCDSLNSFLTSTGHPTQSPGLGDSPPQVGARRLRFLEGSRTIYKLEPRAVHPNPVFISASFECPTPGS